MHRQARGRRLWWLSFVLGGLGIGVGSPAMSQTASGTSPSLTPPAVSAREAQLEARVRTLEEMVDRLSRRVGQLSSLPRTTGHSPGGRPGAAAGAGPARTTDAQAPGGLGATGVQRPSPLGSAEAARPAEVAGPPTKGTFGNGFQWQTADEEYQLQFHNLTQVDGRFFQPGNQNPVHDTFAIPRQWDYFSGRLTKPFEYNVSFAHGFAALSLLDAYLNIHFDDRLQFKIGRYFVPFTFEPYFLPVYALITPEFSLFFNNFEPNRSIGMMAWGQLARKRLDYAAGIFNGTRNAFVDTHDPKDFIGFLNARPFGEAGIPALEYLNLGGSVDYGDQSNPPLPQTLNTIVPIPGNPTVGVPFLTFNNNVRESGVRALWSFHVAYYYRQLSLLGEWDAGFQDYALGTGASRTRLPVESFYVAAGYFLTGETVASRGAVQPLRPFDLRKGKLGPGAWELGFRYNRLELGDQVFTHGLADPNLWSDRVSTIDVGVNWYWSQYVKVAIFWEHAEFGKPVLSRPGTLQLSNNLFLMRFQVRF